MINVFVGQTNKYGAVLKVIAATTKNISQNNVSKTLCMPILTPFHLSDHYNKQFKVLWLIIYNDCSRIITMHAMNHDS